MSDVKTKATIAVCCALLLGCTLDTSRHGYERVDRGPPTDDPPNNGMWPEYRSVESNPVTVPGPQIIKGVHKQHSKYIEWRPIVELKDQAFRDAHGNWIVPWKYADE